MGKEEPGIPALPEIQPTSDERGQNGQAGEYAEPHGGLNAKPRLPLLFIADLVIKGHTGKTIYGETDGEKQS